MVVITLVISRANNQYEHIRKTLSFCNEPVIVKVVTYFPYICTEMTKVINSTLTSLRLVKLQKSVVIKCKTKVRALLTHLIVKRLKRVPVRRFMGVGASLSGINTCGKRQEQIIQYHM